MSLRESPVIHCESVTHYSENEIIVITVVAPRLTMVQMSILCFYRFKNLDYFWVSCILSYWGYHIYLLYPFC